MGSPIGTVPHGTLIATLLSEENALIATSLTQVNITGGIFYFHDIELEPPFRSHVHVYLNTTV
jgi:hypothetical protein